MTLRSHWAELLDSAQRFSVGCVELYDASGVTVYSDEASLVGVDDSENPHVQDALAG